MSQYILLIIHSLWAIQRESREREAFVWQQTPQSHDMNLWVALCVDVKNLLSPILFTLLAPLSAQNWGRHGRNHPGQNHHPWGTLSNCAKLSPSLRATHRAILRCLGHKQLLPALRLLESGLSLPRTQRTKEFPQLQLRQTLKWNWLEVQYVPPLFSCHGRGWTRWTSGHTYQYNCSSLLAKPAQHLAIATFQNGLIWIPEAKHRSDSPCHGPGLTADTNVTRETQFSIIWGSCYSH